MFNTITEHVTTIIIQKKSKFIADLYPIDTKLDIEKILKEIRKRYHDAKHHCYAYRFQDKDGLIEQCSDDGEPSGTAGAPMLAILRQKGIMNIILVVTRYFGGILLGTSGLVRAYSQSALQAVDKCTLIMEEPGFELEIMIEYKELDNLKYYCKRNKIFIQQLQYLDKIKCILELNDKEKNKIIEDNAKNIIKLVQYKVVKEKNIKKNIEI